MFFDEFCAKSTFRLCFYDALGRVDHTVDQIGRTTKNQYDPVFGKLSETDYADGTNSKTQYDADSRTYLSTARSGRGSLTEYDSLGRVTDTYPLDQTGNKLPDGNGGYVHTHTAYDLNGAVLSSTDENGHSSGSQYDSLGRAIVSTDALGNSTSTTYDNDGRVVSATDANNHTVTTDYDPDGRPITTHYPDGTYSTVQYDALGRKQFVTDQAGHTTQFHYDALGRLDEVIDPMTYTTTYGYDELGHKIRQTDANNHTVTMDYDSMGRLIRRTLPAQPTGYSDPARRSETRDYDALGRLWHMTDNNGLVTTFDYDPNSGSLLTKAGSNGDWVSFTYNPDGTIATESRGSGSTTYNTITNSYDSATGRLSCVHGPNGEICYAYDNAGNKTETDVYAPDGSLSSKTYLGYDADDRLQTVSHNADLSSPIANYQYDNVGNRSLLTRGNGVTTSYTYDALNRLTDLTNSAGPSFHYHLTPDGKRDVVTEYGNLTPGTTTYQYDPDGRLTSEVETLTSGTMLVNNTYQYDAVGNRQYKIVSGAETDYHYDPNDRITDTGYSFDANGNQTTVNGQPATYDFENHLVLLGSVSAPVAVYSYDGKGNRISTQTAGGTTRYLIDSRGLYPRIAEERDFSGSLVARFDSIEQHEDTSSDYLEMQRGETSCYYYLFDGRGSTRALAGASGRISDTWAYDAFGNIIAPDTGETPNEFLYDGQQLDDTSLTYYLRARYYAPSDGRMTACDPFDGNPQIPMSMHKYMYANGDPVNCSDPSGKETMVDVEAAMVDNTIIEEADTETSEFSLETAGAMIEEAYGTGGMSAAQWFAGGLAAVFSIGTVLAPFAGLTTATDQAIDPNNWANYVVDSNIFMDRLPGGPSERQQVDNDILLKPGYRLWIPTPVIDNELSASPSQTQIDRRYGLHAFAGGAQRVEWPEASISWLPATALVGKFGTNDATICQTAVELGIPLLTRNLPAMRRQIYANLALRKQFDALPMFNPVPGPVPIRDMSK